MSYQDSLRVMAIGAEADTWRQLQGYFFGPKQEGTLQICWGAVGMVAMRAGTAPTELGIYDVQLVQTHFQPTEEFPGATRVSCQWQDPHKSGKIQEVVLENGRVIGMEDGEGYAPRLEACMRVGLLLPHIIFDQRSSERVADKFAQTWSCTSFTGYWERQVDGIVRPQEAIDARHVRVSEEISVANLLHEYPNA